jgi:hypothetical protein
MSDNALDFHDNPSDLLCGSNLLDFFGPAMQDVLADMALRFIGRVRQAEHVSVHLCQENATK